MESSKAFLRLPIKSRGTLTAFKTHRDLGKLFIAINQDINTQNTTQSRGVRRSNYRGILRNVFKLSEAEMRPIETGDAEKQQYFDALKKGQDNQHEDKVNEDLIKKIIAVSPVCELMVRSGLRISELLDNPSHVTNKFVKFKLNKKKDNEFYDIHIIGSIPHWVALYKQMKTQFKGIVSHNIIDSINIKLKGIIPPDFYKRSSHICRALYVRYIYTFREPPIDTWTLPRIISTYLHHDNTNASAYYQHVVFSGDMTNFLNPVDEEKKD